MSDSLPVGSTPGERPQVRRKVTSFDLRSRKRAAGSDPIVMITAYDAPGASIVDQSGADVILVGDSVGNNVLGYPDSMSVDMDEMVHHVGAVARSKPQALVVGDLPWMSYHVDIPDSVRNAARLIRAGAEAVKLEGGRVRVPVIEAIVQAEIPVVGHLGLTPQSVLAFGGFKVQGKEVGAAEALIADAKSIESAGCFAIVLEGIPDVVAARITESVAIPTIGIGAGRECDGQVLVFHDLLGLGEGKSPKFVRRYGDLRSVAIEALSAWASDVRSGGFPSDAETYHLPGSMPG